MKMKTKHLVVVVLAFSAVFTFFLVTAEVEELNVVLGEAAESDLVASSDSPNLYVDREYMTKSHTPSTNAFLNHLETLQNPPDCDTAKILVASKARAKGMTAILQDQLFCFAVAMQLNRTFIWEGDMGSYTSRPPECNGKKYECFFEELSPCGASTKNWDPLPHSDWTALRDNDARVIRMDGPEMCRTYIANGGNSVKNLDYVPDYLKHVPGAVHWFSGGLLQYMLRPNAVVRKYLADIQASIPYPVDDDGSVVSIHLRRGDKFRENGVAPPLSDFLRMATILKEENDFIKNVYLATDDPGVKDEALETVERDYGFNLLYQPISVADLGHQRQTASSQYAASLGIIADIHMLSMADFLIGTCTSGVDRTASSMIIFKVGVENLKNVPIHMEKNRRCRGDGWNPVSRDGIWTEPPFDASTV